MTTNGTEFTSMYKTSDGCVFDTYDEAAKHARWVNNGTSAGCCVIEQKVRYYRT